MAAVVFWSAVVLVLYTYGGYLLLLVLADAGSSLSSAARYLSGLERRRRDGPRDLPIVSVLIAAHNEASCIQQKIENTLARVRRRAISGVESGIEPSAATERPSRSSGSMTSATFPASKSCFSSS